MSLRRHLDLTLVAFPIITKTNKILFEASVATRREVTVDATELARGLGAASSAAAMSTPS